MKILKILILIVGVSVIYPFIAMAGQITHNVTYDSRKVSVSYNHGAINVYYDKIVTIAKSSGTNLPNEILLFSVPYNATDIQVNLTVYSNYYINLNDIKFQNRDSSATILLDDWKVEQTDSASSLRSFNPLIQCKIESSGYVLGDNQIVKVWVSPFAYSSSGILKLIHNADICLSYQTDSSITPPIVRRDAEAKILDFDLIRSGLVNGDSLSNNSYTFTQPIPVVPPSPYSLPTYEYCIITNRELAPSFNKIIAMKRQKGLSAGIVCVEDLMASPLYNCGDVQGGSYATIADSAGVVRQYLKYAFQSQTEPTKFVLMGGKAPYAPVRYVHSTARDTDDRNHVSTDMYFSNLSLPWVHHSSNYDYHNESEYIIPDSVNMYSSLPFYPDLFVGRLLCATREDVDNYSEKLYKYIFKAGKGDYSYISKSLFANMISDGFNTLVNRYLGNTFYDIDHINNSTEHLTGSQFVDYLNSNRYGFLSLHAHGEPQSIMMYEQNNIKYLLTALDRNQMINGNYEEDGNGLDCLSNNNFPFICYTNSCTTMPYDKGQNFCGSTQFEDNYSFGASFTLGKNYGGPAFLGNTRESLSGSEKSLEIEFLRSIFYRQHYSLGISEALSKVLFYQSDVLNNVCNHTLLTHNLLGDPEFKMWTAEPQPYENIRVSYMANYILIEGVTESDTVAYCDNDGVFGWTLGSELFYLVGMSPSVSIMIYNHDHIPYLVPLMLQNCNINYSQYVYTSSFSAGKAVVPSITHGNVTIKHGAVYEVEATDEVQLGEGFIVENGATFNIKTPGKVIIDGCVFQSGANVKIEAGSVEIVKSFTAEQGSKVEFKQLIDD